KEYGRDLADITDRQNVQFHWIRIEDVPAIWERLEGVGLSSLQACGDVPRNILGCPVAGIDAGEILDASGVLRAVEAVAASNPEFTNLPRKYKTAVSGCSAQCTVPEINDISFVGVTGPGGEPGFDLWVGGGLSTNPMLARRLGVFVAPDQAPAVWAGVTSLWQVADLAECYGSGRVRTTPQQKLLILDVPEANVAELSGELAARDLQVNPSPFRRGTMACTGIEFCKLAIVETKQRAASLYAELERRLPDFDVPVSINVNGCPNSCARFQVADIGFKGSIVDGGEGFQVHLGGSLGNDPAFGRKLRGLKVTADGLPDYTERVLRNYLAGRAEGEQFAAWARRADEKLLV